MEIKKLAQNPCRWLVSDKMVLKRNKKGLSNIVATVLIVLLSLAAVVIVWGFLRPVFDTTSSETNLRTKCLNVDIQPQSCVYSESLLKVVVRNIGGDAKYIAIDAVSGTGSSVVNMRKDAGSLLGTVVFTNDTLSGLDGNSIKKVNVAGIVVGNANEESLCPPVTISCVFNSNP